MQYQQAGNPTVQKQQTPVAPVKQMTPAPASDISNAFAGTAQFKAPSQVQTYIPSTGKTYYGQEAVNVLAAQPKATQTQINQVQPSPPQNVSQVPQSTVKPTQPVPSIPAPVQPQQNLQPSSNAQNSQTIPSQTPQVQIPQIPQENATPSLNQMGQTQTGNFQQDMTGSSFNQSTDQTSFQSSENSTDQSVNPFNQSLFDDQGNPIQFDAQGKPLPPAPTMSSVLNSEHEKSFDGQLQELLTGDPSTSSATLLKQNLLAQLGAIDDPTANEYLDNQEARAQSAYEAGLAMNQKGADEIQKAIAGELEAPETSEGLAAKVAKESKDQQLASTQAQQDYLQKKNELDMQQLRESRASVEGYAKALLGSIGATESSAGITLMNKVTTQTDLLIQSANLDYNYSQQQLNQQSSKIQSDFTNQVASLAVQNNQNKMQIISDYNTQLSKIDDNRFANEQQKRQQKVAAFNDYTSSLLKSQQDFKSFSLEAMKFAQQQHEDLIDDAIKQSGLTGTIYMPDKNGNLVDTGIQTYASKKDGMDLMLQTQQFSLDQQKFGFDQYQFERQQSLAEQQFGLQQFQANVTKVQALFNSYKDSNWDPNIADKFDQMTGSPQGTYGQFQTKSEAQEYFNQQTKENEAKLASLNQYSPQITSSDALKQVFNVDGHGGQCGTWASTISTAPRVGNSWNEKASHIQKQDGARPGDKLLVPLAGANTDGNKPGHVAVVLSSNPPIVNVVQANMDGKGTISLGSYNMNDLNQKYQNNWGFVNGQFQPQIQQKLSQLSPQDSLLHTYTPPIPENSKNNGGGLSFAEISAGIKKTRGTEYTDQQISEINNLASRFQQVSNEVRTLDVGYSFAKNFDINTTNPYDDQALITNFMKVLDPGSVVREGESQAVKDNASRMDSLIGGLQNAISGKGMLLPQQRAKILDTMKTLHDQKMLTYEPQLDAAVKQGQAVGINDPRAYLDYTPDDVNPQKAAQKDQMIQISTQVRAAQNAGYNTGQIFQKLLTNPATLQDVSFYLQSGKSPDEIVQYYLSPQ